MGLRLSASRNWRARGASLSSDYAEIRRLCAKFACDHTLDRKGMALEALGTTAMRQRKWAEAIACLEDSIKAELRGGIVAGAQFLAAPVERDAPVDASEARTFLARDVGEGASVVGVAGERARESRVVVPVGGGSAPTSPAARSRNRNGPRKRASRLW